MSRNIAYKTFDYVIPAGGAVGVQRDTSQVTCLEASAPFRVKFDNGPASDFEAGLTYRPPEGFELFEMINPGAEPITVKIALGKGDIRDARMTLNGEVDSRERAPDVLTTGGPKVCPGGGAVTLVAAANELRREIMLVNTSGAVTVWAGGDPGAGGGHGLPILPNQSLVLQTAAAVYIRHSAGSSVNIAVAELEWAS